jgi:hypothetical protein
MEHWKNLFVRAFSETWNSIVEVPWKGVVMVVILTVTIFIVTRIFLGKETAHENVVSTIVTLIGTMLVFSLFCTQPVLPHPKADDRRSER